MQNEMVYSILFYHNFEPSVKPETAVFTKEHPPPAHRPQGETMDRHNRLLRRKKPGFNLPIISLLHWLRQRKTEKSGTASGLSAPNIAKLIIPFLPEKN
jgi:hypothetical protein